MKTWSSSYFRVVAFRLFGEIQCCFQYDSGINYGNKCYRDSNRPIDWFPNYFRYNIATIFKQDVCQATTTL